MEIGELIHPLMGVLFTLVGGGLIVWQALAMERAAASRRWPRASGKVLRVSMDEREDTETLGGHLYLVKVICQYRVGDSEYTCDRLRFGIASWDQRWVARLSRALKKYSAGDRVEIAFNPQKPEESVLEPGFAPTLLTGFLFSFAFFAAGLLLLRQ